MLKICVIGLGYVGLPICLKLAKNYKIVGFDINSERVNSLKKGIDLNDEFKKKDIKKKNLVFTKNIQDINECNFFIICVPTPITNSKQPDLRYINKSFVLLSKILKKGDIIVLESTVYPGVTEEFVNKLEKKTKLINNQDFTTCYSPERINPGDKERNLNNINKILAYEGNNKKVKACKDLGADLVINYKENDFVKKIVIVLIPVESVLSSLTVQSLSEEYQNTNE